MMPWTAHALTRGPRIAATPLVLGALLTMGVLPGCSHPKSAPKRLSSPTSLHSVSCPTVEVCVAVGSQGRALVTSDGGRRWQVVETLSRQDLESVSCATSTQCVAAGDASTLLFSSDGGASWRRSKVPKIGGQKVVAVSCPDSRHCIAAGQEGAILRSFDGGARWEQAGSMNALLTSLSCYHKLCTAVSLRTGLSSPSMAFVSLDLGSSWVSTLVEQSKNLYGVQCTSSYSCTAVGDEAVVDSTADGGTTWIGTTLPEYGSLVSVDCLSNRPCLVGGDFGSIFMWLGGSHWKQVAPAGLSGTHEVIEGISCPGRKLCWAVGDQGTVVHSRDGGQSWKVVRKSSASGNARILIVGDSVAQSFASELPSMAPHYGLYVVDEGILGCGVAEGEPVIAGGVTYTSIAPPCNGKPGVPQWPSYWKQYVEQLHPAVAVLLAGYWEVCDRMYQGTMTNILQPAYRDYVESQLELAVSVLSAQGAHVVLLTSPYFDTGNFPEDDPARVNAYNALVDHVAAAHPRTVTVLDLNAEVDPGGVYSSTVDGVVVRSADNEHFSTAGSQLTGRWILPKLAQLTGRPASKAGSSAEHALGRLQGKHRPSAIAQGKPTPRGAR